MGYTYYLDTPDDPVTCLTKLESGEYRFLTETGRDRAHFHELPRPAQELVLRWLRWNLVEVPDINRRHNSGEINHILYERTGQKLTENEFREAMMHIGFFPERTEKREWYFFVDEHSPAFAIQRDGKRGLPLLGSPVTVDCADAGYPLPDDGHGDRDGRF